MIRLKILLILQITLYSALAKLTLEEDGLEEVGCGKAEAQSDDRQRRKCARTS